MAALALTRCMAKDCCFVLSDFSLGFAANESECCSVVARNLPQPDSLIEIHLGCILACGNWWVLAGSLSLAENCMRWCCVTV